VAYVPLSFFCLPAAPADVRTQAVRQTVRIVSIDHPQNLLRTGDRASVLFEFIAHPEFVKAGMKLLFREGKTKVNVPKLFVFIM
jgi:GTPase